MAKSANLSGSREPIWCPRRRLWAALMVTVVIASAGVIFICVAASESTMGMEAVGELPGLKSVASTTGRPRSIMRRGAPPTGRGARGAEALHSGREQLCLRAGAVQAGQSGGCASLQSVGGGGMEFGGTHRAVI